MLISSPQSILVIHVSRIGDTLLATPALRAIAAAWPGARMTVLAHPKRSEVLEHLPFVAEVGSITKGRSFWRGRMPGRRFSLAFVYGYDPALVRYALRVSDKVIAFRQEDAVLNARLFRCVEPMKEGHATESLLALPQAVGVAADGRRLAYCVTDAEKQWARKWRSRHLPPDNWPLVGLQVASFPTKAWRDWPPENFAALCERILAKYPRAHFLIFGGKSERTRTNMLHECFASRSTLLAGKLTLRQTAAMMGLLDLYVGVDTGPTHIMGTFDIPLIALYHCKSTSRVFGPLEHPACVPIDHPLADNPAAPADASMADISVKAVFEAVDEILEKRSAHRSPSP